MVAILLVYIAFGIQEPEMPIEANSPDLSQLKPIVFADGKVWPFTVFLKNAVDHPRITVGEYTYFNDFSRPENYAHRIAPYLHYKSREKVEIGKFCQIAHGAQIITSSSMHQYDGISAYPFAIYPEWNKAYESNFPFCGDNIIGNDVWLGHECVIMPGVKIGSDESRAWPHAGPPLICDGYVAKVKTWYPLSAAAEAA